ncbi:MAG: trypsin-like peptidase domain-containing protein [Bacteroidota bacterium]
MKTFWTALIASLLSAIFAVGLYRTIEKPKEIIVKETIPARYTNYTDELLSGKSQRQFLSSSPTNFIAAASKATPAVVNIKASRGGDYFWESLSASTGSGVIISPNGYIVTNNHVIEEGKVFRVTLYDKREYNAKLVGTDPSTDLALLKVNGDKLPFLPFGNSDSLQTGEWVLAVGNPFNLESTVTAGIVSAKGRNIHILEDAYSIESFIQTDAAVNPGNSGGALVNTNGELIGINTAIITRSGKYEGYSFAVPADLVRKVIRDIRDFGVVQRGILGVSIAAVTDNTAKRLRLKGVKGVLITAVTLGGGADDAGMEKDDVVTSINGVETNSMPELQEQVARYRPGNKIKVEFVRNGAKKMATIVLKNRGNTTELVNARKGKVLEDLGFELRNLTKAEQKRLETTGVYVKSIYRNSLIEETNMELGFIITSVNDRPVETVDEVVESLSDKDGLVMLGGVYEEYDGEYFYEFRK